MTQADKPKTAGDLRAEVIGRIAKAIVTESLTAGQVVEMRRLSEDDPSSPAFFRVMAQYIEPALQLSKMTEDKLLEQERRWAVVLRCMANVPHKQGALVGRALAEAGYSEPRFARLLRSHGKGLADQLRFATYFLSSRGFAVDWVKGSGLVFSDGAANEERIRRSIARDYYWIITKTKAEESPADHQTTE